MFIRNETNNTIKVFGRDTKLTEVNPNDSMFIYSRMFDDISVHSEEGSCIISVSFGERKYETFGNLTAHEDDLKHVVIQAK